ncbi:hypothetical protein [Nocardioides sp. zg-DK7169]|uniref:hypothetical protein n=1 Tax=Nocardioides sp. zg-DK7169 TaxID=2736600 RepID=UPI0015554CC6|nr:hypothetical protein [Nocardioides sp. zg-DK7169]NPC95664.1 hypothetical protein [Nocardioides sp. zg-DK7169]
MDVTAWLLDGDPAVRWQTLRDVVGAPEDEVALERARVATEGWGARLLELRGADGLWAGGACFPRSVLDAWRAGLEPDFSEGQPWTATLPQLALLRELGLDPGSEVARQVVAQVAAGCRWEHDDEAFFDGEVEACINGRTLAIGAYFGADVDALAARLLDDQLGDGGWNCWTEHGATVSSFDSTICVLEGLREVEAAHGSPAVTEARRRGEEYLLERGLFRSLRTGEVPEQRWLEPAYPTRWHYDVLRALDHLRAAGGSPDPRAAEAVALVRDKQQADGRWLLERVHPGESDLLIEEAGRPSRWTTLRALRVLDWYDGR